MRHTILGTCISILVVSVITMFAAIYASDIRAERAEATKEDIPIPKQETTTENDIYILKESDGKLAVFLEGEEQPREVFNVYIKTLPSYDQGQLHQGIKVESYGDLISLIEDYIS